MSCEALLRVCMRCIAIACRKGVSVSRRGVQGASQAWHPHFPLQQEACGRDTNTVPVCPFKFQVHFFSIVLLVTLCYAMSCYALLCHSQLVGIDTVHTHAPLYHCSTTTNPSEELATDSGIEHESYCVLPCMPKGTVLCYHEISSCFCLDVTVVLGLVLFKHGAAM